MPNDNHEQYNGNNICTYTDLITIGNTLTTEQVDACVLAAGEAPADNPKKIYLDNKASQPGPNSFSPFYFVDPDLWYSEEELIDAKGTWYNYLHTVYASTVQNALATELKVNNYRNFVSITPYTETINGTPYTYYGMTITTKYGDNSDPESTWTNSILKPMYVLAEGDARTGLFLDEIMCKQEYNFTNSWGSMCTDLGFIQGRRNLKDNESGGIIPYGIWQGGLAPEAYHIEGGRQYGNNFDHHLQWQNNPSTFYTASVYNNIDDLLFIAAIGGLKFEYNNTLYKPIVEGGVVVGYTDDMSEVSEWDEWEDIGDHDIPVTPPGPTPPGPGYDDDPWSGASFSGVGVGGAGAFAKCYYMTSTELANLRSWMNSINVPEGFDPMQQIIGLSQVPVALSGSGPENVVFVNSSAVYDPGVTTRAVDTGVATQQAMGTPISYYLGSVDIVRRMQERGEPYLDYDCQIELYLPLIGMFSLDTQAVMGRTISAYAILDPVSGTLAAYAYVSKDGQNLPIAYGSTTIGVDLPISAQQLSVSRAALKQANAQLGASLLSGALTMLAAASTGGKSSGSGAKTSTGSNGLSAAGIREAGSDYMKASQVGNVFGDFMNWGRTIRQLSYGNNTAVAGSFGGSTAQWSYPFTPYVKIIRPRYEKPSNYAHSQGVPCVQTKTIGSCTGFIQCIGADVSGITGATDLELQAIQAALSNGIYAGGGQ